MKENIRRLVLFAVIVGTGSVMIFVNVPLIVLLPLIIAIGFLLLVLLGSITIIEIKNAVSKLALKNLRQQPFLKKLDSIKFFEKKTTQKKDIGEKKGERKAPAKPAEKTNGIRYHLSLLGSSVTSFGKILTERKKPAKKPDEINKLLEHTITEKVSRVSALDRAAAAPSASGSKRSGAGGARPAENRMESDPFLKLSGEELETGLLDELLDEQEPAAEPHPVGQAHAGTDPALSMTALEMPVLPDETAVDAEAILIANADTGFEELTDLDGVDAVDETLGYLDSIDLDDINLLDDRGMLEPTPQAPVSQAGDPMQVSDGFIPATPFTPAGGSGSNRGDNQGDLSSFVAGGAAPGVDDDMLSSLATEIKHVKKEKDVSLLRELKDFKAPATDIEKEFSEVSEQLSAAGKGAKKKIPSPQGIK